MDIYPASTLPLEKRFTEQMRLRQQNTGTPNSLECPAGH